jgi:hypothetical protein
MVDVELSRLSQDGLLFVASNGEYDISLCELLYIYSTFLIARLL